MSEKHLFYVRYFDDRYTGIRTQETSVVESTVEEIDDILEKRGIGETRYYRLEEVGWKPGDEEKLKENSDNWHNTMLSYYGRLSTRMENTDRYRFSDLHYACYLSYILLSGGHCTPDELLGDGGFLHELIHSYGSQEGKFIPTDPTATTVNGNPIENYRLLTRDELIDYAKKIEDKVPGLIKDTNLLFRIENGQDENEPTSNPAEHDIDKQD